jgi:hypothetical protein
VISDDHYLERLLAQSGPWTALERYRLRLWTELVAPTLKAELLVALYRRLCRESDFRQGIVA